MIPNSNALITFTISDDDLRGELIEFLEEQGWVDFPDQSTMIYPLRNGRFNEAKLTHLQNFIELKNWDKEDRIILTKLIIPRIGSAFLRSEFLLGGD